MAADKAENIYRTSRALVIVGVIVLIEAVVLGTVWATAPNNQSDCCAQPTPPPQGSSLEVRPSKGQPQPLDFDLQNGGGTGQQTNTGLQKNQGNDIQQTIKNPNFEQLDF